MTLEELLAADPNTLPYRLRRLATGEVVVASFEPSTAEDAEESGGEDWRGAKFAEVWPEFVELPGTLKLVLAHGEDRRIQGIMRLGQVEAPSCPLTGSLLESAPWNQEGAEPRGYAGVGRALVRRLVVESLRQGGEGSILDRAAPGSVGFYRALGFVVVPPGEPPDHVFLTRKRAFELLEEAWGVTYEP